MTEENGRVSTRLTAKYYTIYIYNDVGELLCIDKKAARSSVYY